ncbi:MAG: phage protein Gp27 family protein [Treponemataceae bacterium]
MGRKGKAEANGLVELIVDKWEGGRNTIIYVTEEVNKILKEKGLHATFSRESIRRVIKSQEEAIADTRKSIEIAKAMADVLKDNPGTEIAEATIMHISSLIAKDIRSIDSLEFDDPEKLVNSAARMAESQLKLSQYRTKAIKALDKAKNQLKLELQREIQSDAELLTRLCSIIDKVEVK